MERPDYIELFSIPNDYKPPDDSELRLNTQYPNLNSKDYRKKPIDRTPRIQPFFECLDINEGGNCILACNDIRGRIWDGFIWGFENIADVGDQEKACFKLHCESPITNMRYIKDKIFFLTEADGTVQLWSTKSEMRNLKDYCLFMIGGKTEHTGIILSMDTLNADPSKVVTGSNDSTLKIWDTGAGDLFSVHTLRYAHSDAITGISSSPNHASTFATCSKDRSALLWDYRQQRPATALLEYYPKVGLSSISWPRSELMDQNIVIGDEAGFIFSVDIRAPHKRFHEIRIFNRPIRKIKFHLNQVAVIGNTNIVKVLRWTKVSGYEVLYKDSQAKNFIRDAFWNTWTENELYTVGWDQKICKHLIE